MQHLAQSRRGRRAPSRRESGQALAESTFFALGLVTLLIGGIDIGKYADTSMILTSASRAGVQYGAQNLAVASDTTGMQAAATNEAHGLGVVSATATQYCTCQNATLSSCSQAALNSCTVPALIYVKVTTTGTFTPLVPFPGIGNMGVSRTVSMQVSP